MLGRSAYCYASCAWQIIGYPYRPAASKGCEGMTSFNIWEETVSGLLLWARGHRSPATGTLLDIGVVALWIVTVLSPAPKHCHNASCTTWLGCCPQAAARGITASPGNTAGAEGFRDVNRLSAASY